MEKLSNKGLVTIILGALMMEMCIRDRDITLPNLIGWSKKEVQTYASLAGIQLTIDGTSGHVTAQSVGENTVVHSGDSLIVAIS